MSVHAQCPVCRQKQSLKNKRCRCGEDLDRAKKATRVKYWIAYRIPLDSSGGEAKMVQRWEFVGYSLEEAKDANAKRRVEKRKNRKIAMQGFDSFMQEEFARSLEKGKVDHSVDQTGKEF